MQGFLAGQSSLNVIEAGLLGDVRGKSVLHLQCHFGQDTLSLARSGAEVCGVDFSEQAIKKAKELSAELLLPANFICTDIYELPRHLDRQFDIVFTSYGVLGWLPDMQQWADIVCRYLKPGGTFVLVEFHPVAWMFDNDFTRIQYSYFNREVIEETEAGTYADESAPIELSSLSWNHDLGEVLQGLLSRGLKLEIFREFDYSPYNCFKNMTEFAPKKYYIKGLEGKIPLLYALKAIK
jgi:SAM-dependent methyltransferase